MPVSEAALEKVRVHTLTVSSSVGISHLLFYKFGLLNVRAIRAYPVKMSRICVKNIPKYLTEERLREHFSAKGEVTDAKIIRTSDGYSRQFGFVGFRTEEGAQEAMHFFDRSYLDTCRLTCELAYPVGDSHLVRPWSRYSEGSSAFQKVAGPGADEGESLDTEETAAGEGRLKEAKSKGKEGTKEGKRAESKGGETADEENDPLLQEFLEVMLPASKRKLWSNDVAGGVDGAGAQRKGKAGQPEGGRKGGKEKKDTSKKEGKESKGKTRKGKSAKGSLSDESDSESAELYDNELELEEGDGVVANRHGRAVEEGEESEEDGDGDGGMVHDNAVSDLDYLKSRVKTEWSDEEEEEGKGGDGDEGEEEEEEEEEEGEEGVEDAILGGEGEREEGEEGEGEDGKGLAEEEEEERGAHQRGDEEEAGPREVDAEQQEGVAETGRLFVRNLCYTATEEDLRELFAPYGELSEVHLVVDKETGRSKGFAYVLFMLPENAVQALKELDLSIFQGRLLHILPAKRPPPPKDSGGKGAGVPGGTTQYKQEREEQRKASEAAGATQAWSTLFMRADTVAENVAEKYGVEKRELLNPEADDLAVRLALGETHIVAETKKGLEAQGVDVAALEAFVSRGDGGGKKKRSSRVVLVKNLPFSAMEADLVGMFGKFGSLGKVVLPPTKTLALVEFLEASDARRAFKGLAYKRFQHVPLYLEWAPEGILPDRPTGAPPAEVARKEKVRAQAGGEEAVKRIQVAQALVPEEDEADTGEARSLFVKNLNFGTSERGLRDHFQKGLATGAVRSVLIKTKPAANGKQLSMGFGFVELDSAETAKAACQQLQGSVLDKHALVLQLSHGTRTQRPGGAPNDSQRAQPRKDSFTKLIARNVAFEATKKDLRQLFNPFGQVKSLRLPKKFDGSHRGFAFIEFITKQEAQNAFDALQSTHLYGRHLVLEKAKEGEGLEELRAKTAAQFHGDGAAAGATSAKRRKLSEVVEADDAL